ncbi:DUF4129 domain-containing protein [Natrarchaeobius chitinivorans]|uniref:DUF4129 domain-containing protein n=1 Tax=Natrarchaeobius chitinivorans TaxID=1679083 RepID=A0A3N6M2G5_NATCH|nr:DUF4129 domain-containing protein [Natrarchaeobius chitinivorans]RQG95987.1 DUF4129 domain-containing protein [Natrarchaeobius chitinivorans]
MSRTRTVTRIAVALVGIAAVAMAAATISSPVERGGDGELGGDGPIGMPAQESGETAFEVPFFLEVLVFLLLVLAALVIVWYLLTHPREFFTQLGVALALLLLIAAVFWVLLRFGVIDPSALEEPPPPPPEGTPGDGDPGDGENDQQPFSIGPLLLLLTALAFVLAVAVAWSTGGVGSSSNSSGSAGVDGEDPDGSHAAVAAAAGRAADRIESSDDVDNEVYRAWLEMTRPLEVDRPETSTPGEFAAAAVDAGLAREDVAELTSLFEDVRYGDEETTGQMETRATAVLRRIEAEYADTEEAPTDGDEPGERT